MPNAKETKQEQASKPDADMADQVDDNNNTEEVADTVPIATEDYNFNHPEFFRDTVHIYHVWDAKSGREIREAKHLHPLDAICELYEIPPEQARRIKNAKQLGNAIASYLNLDKLKTIRLRQFEPQKWRLYINGELIAYAKLLWIDYHGTKKREGDDGN